MNRQLSADNGRSRIYVSINVRGCSQRRFRFIAGVVRHTYGAWRGLYALNLGWQGESIGRWGRSATIRHDLGHTAIFAGALCTTACMLRKRWADRADLKRCILRSRRRHRLMSAPPER